MPKYVFSSTLEDPEWNNSTVIDGDVATAVSQVRQDVDSDIVVNGKRPAGRHVTSFSFTES